MNESEIIQDALKHVVLVQIDCEKGDGPQIAEKYGVGGYPTFIAVNADGEITDSIIGYDTAEAWARFAESSAVDRRTIAEKTAAYETRPTAALARSLGNRASTTYDFKGAVGYFQAARDLDPDHADEYTEQVLTNLYYGGADAFTFDQVEAEVKPAFHAPEAEVSDKFRLAGMITEVAKSAGEPKRAAPYLEAAMALEVDPEDEELADSRADIAVDAALIVDGNPERAVALKKATLPDDWMETTRGLFSFSWWCFENEVNLEEAFDLAMKSHELAGDDKGRSTALRIAAEICNARGDCAQAVDLMRRAVELNPDRKSYKTRLADFKKLLEEQKQG